MRQPCLYCGHAFPPRALHDDLCVSCWAVEYLGSLSDPDEMKWHDPFCFTYTCLCPETYHDEPVTKGNTAIAAPKGDHPL